MLRSIAKTVLARTGYVVKDVGTGVAGVDWLHDARCILQSSAPPLVFDIGANTGQTIAAVRRIFPAARIVAFEPSPHTFLELQRAFGSAAGVTLEQLAMGSQAGELPFHVTSDHSVNDSLLAPAWKQDETIVTVHVDTVDRYCENRGIDVIDVLKTDTQGYDLEVLKGARAMLERGAVKLCFFEVTLKPMYEGQPELRDFLALIADLRYELVGVYEQGYMAGRLVYFNLLCRKPDR